MNSLCGRPWIFNVYWTSQKIMRNTRSREPKTWEARTTNVLSIYALTIQAHKSLRLNNGIFNLTPFDGVWQAITRSSYTVLRNTRISEWRDCQWTNTPAIQMTIRARGELETQINAPHRGDGQSIVMHWVISGNVWQIWHLITSPPTLRTLIFLTARKCSFTPCTPK